MAAYYISVAFSFRPVTPLALLLFNIISFIETRQKKEQCVQAKRKEEGPIIHYQRRTVNINQLNNRGAQTVIYATDRMVVHSSR